ncbi:hypothetical protein OPKNFCMD_3864 [Methylobacterium crusticola]|uniref:Uncharacterized protein n=1 Tax=Methylobacterium crusticola TaxID=1697972 RepID=A0ABQ4R0B8_9HYPH|nr:hypothetical protein [Methylobacterium crusticola]GJD51113.1 hypothetical protein OPKNFCMD_3864 [Methylobacterium crusticola]
MLAPTFLAADAAERAALFARLDQHLAGFRIPGGDVRVWLREVVTWSIRGCLMPEPCDTARLLMEVVGRLNRAHERDRLVDPEAADLVNLIDTPLARAAVKGWARTLLKLEGEVVA